MKETTDLPATQGFGRWGSQRREYLCVLKRNHKRQKMRIMKAQRNFNKLIQGKQTRRSILGNIFSKHRSIQSFNIEKLREIKKIESAFKFTEGEGSKCLVSC
jgi:hypothetical protein